MGNESLYLAVISVLFGGLAWASSKIFDRTQKVIDVTQGQLSDLRQEVRDMRQEFEFRLRALEEEGSPPTNRRGNPRAA